MIDKSQESKFVNKIKTALDDSVDNLDAGVSSRLNQARQGALEAGTQRWWSGIVSFRNAAAAAAVVLVLLASTVLYFRHPSGPELYTDIADVEILVTGESPDFYMELEFYTWLAEEAENAG